MPDITQGRLTPFDPGFVTRVAQGMRYALRGVAPDGWFGPGQPLTPQAQQVAGRQFDFPVGINLQQHPRSREAIGFAELRGLADSYDLIRLMIETRKDQIARLAWKIQPRVNSAGSADPRLALLETFFRSPDRTHGWADWLRMLLEDLLVIDAPALYRRKTLGGAPYAFEVIDGATIKRLIDDTGRTPLAPDPAYQQVLKGLPAVDYSTAELLYLPRNPRSHRLYGYSPVEQIVMTVNIALRRQMTQLAYYTEGNTPEALIGVPQDWSPAQIRDFQDYWDSLTSGNSAAKRRSKFVPGGLSYQPTRPPALTDDYDDWLARVVCYAFSVSPTAFVKQVNRATAETSQDSADAEGLAPLMRWVKDCIDRLLSEDFAAPDLEFAWVAEAAQDPLEQAQIDQIYVAAGIKTINEVRANLGLAAVPGGDAPVVELPGISPLPDSETTPSEENVQRVHKFNPAEPRVPKGNPDGGKWRQDASYVSVAQKKTRC